MISLLKRKENNIETSKLFEESERLFDLLKGDLGLIMNRENNLLKILSKKRFIRVLHP